MRVETESGCGVSHAGIECDDRIDTSEAWLGLGETDAERCAAYRELVEARRQEQEKPSQEHDDLPSFCSGTPDYCRTQTERLRQAFREHNRALAAARALRLDSSDTSKKD